ncbi:MAG TPA: hypothetical protein PKD70_04605 [Saprospiraceae bacterium]|nr:hypothetical protein [Saprospiraceae bacterium]HMP13137.1 hypothetical protein [Saprospiraceae bacterium]
MDIIKLLCCASLLVGSSMWLLAQPPSSKEAFEKAYKERIKKEYLDGVYIPADLGDAFVRLNKLIDKDSKEKFKNASEEDAARKLHFSLGRWIIHNWGFYGGSRLSHYLRELGITHPDDMAQFIVVTYHRNLNRRELEVKALVEHYKEMRKKEHEARLEKGTVIHQEVKKTKQKD